MRIPPNSILSILILAGVSSFAAPKPPPPISPGDPPPPGLSIDSGVAILLIIAVVFGLYNIYQLKLNKKTPV